MRAFESLPGNQFFDNLEIPSSSNGRTLRSELAGPSLRSRFRQRARTPAGLLPSSQRRYQRPSAGGNFSFRPLYITNSLLIAPLGVVSGAQKTAFPSIFNERTTRTRLFAIGYDLLDP